MKHDLKGMLSPVEDPNLRVDLAFQIAFCIYSAIQEEREACAKILDEEADFNSGENEQGYCNGDAEDACRRLAKTIRERGQS